MIAAYAFWILVALLGVGGYVWITGGMNGDD